MIPTPRSLHQMEKFKGAIGLNKKTSLAGWEAVAQRDDLDSVTGTLPSAHDPNPSTSSGAGAGAAASAKLSAAASRAGAMFSSFASSIRLPSAFTSASASADSPGSNGAGGAGGDTEMSVMGASARAHSADNLSSAPSKVVSAVDGDDADDAAASPPFAAAAAARVTALLRSCLTSLSEALPDLTYPQRLAGFTLSLCAGGVMLFMCFSMLPGLFLGAAAKFAFAYVFANIFIGLAPCFINGPIGQLESAFADGRRTTALAYFASLALVVFACTALPTVFVVLPALMLQFAMLIWYTASYLPCAGGVNSVMGSLASATVGAALPRGIASRIGM